MEPVEIKEYVSKTKSWTFPPDLYFLDPSSLVIVKKLSNGNLRYVKPMKSITRCQSYRLQSTEDFKQAQVDVIELAKQMGLGEEWY
jgi:hypothetical protein